MKKSQITFFIAFLLIIFLIVGFFLYQVSQVTVEKISDPIPIDTQTVSHMMNHCFDIATDRALLLTARGGGYIHDPEYGYFAPNDSDGKYGDEVLPYVLSGNVTFTGFGVRTGNSSHSLPGPPAYPYEGFLDEDPPSGLYPSYPNHNFYFNFASQDFNLQPFNLYLMPLCDFYGKNQFTFGLALSTCLTYETGLNFQKTMEEYAQELVINCTKKMVQQEYGHTIIDLSNADVDSYIGETDVVFFLNYPVRVGDKMERFLFTTRKNARLKHSYEIAAGMIKEDAKNVFFDMTNRTQVASVNVVRGNIIVVPLSSIIKDFQITRIKNACQAATAINDSILCAKNEWNYSDIIIINDTRSNIDGKQMIFSFAVENRRPALDWIHNPGALDDYYDIVTFTGAELFINPEGYDPDQDNHGDSCSKGPCMATSYNFSGWKADYEEIFNFTEVGDETSNELVNAILNLTSDQHYDFGEDINITKPVDAGGDQILPKNRNFGPKIVSCERGEGLDAGGVCLDNENKWEKSTLFQTTGRQAAITTTLQDAGPHVVRVRVTGRNNLFDYQDIRILIKPLMGGGFNPFVSHIEPEHASWEDHYTIMIQGDALFNDHEGKDYGWYDYCAEGGPILLGGGTINDTDRDALVNITKEIRDPKGPLNHTSNLSSAVACDDSNRLRFIIYDDDDNPEINLSYPLEVYECLPFDGTNPSNVYPFFTGHIQARNHVCCNSGADWGTYKDNTNECFRFEKSYSFWYLNDKYTYDNGPKRFNDPIPPADKVVEEDPSGDVYPNKLSNKLVRLQLIGNPPNVALNSIIKRTFVQKCSGSRGNVCSGVVSDTGEVIHCNYRNIAAGEIASCQWPCNPNHPKCRSAWVGGATIGPGCHNFTPDYVNGFPKHHHRKSFEKNFLGENGGDIGLGLCNPIERCSSNYDVYDDGGGNFLNQGICGGDGHCSAGYMVQNCSELDDYFEDINGEIWYGYGICSTDGANHECKLDTDNPEDLDHDQALCQGAPAHLLSCNNPGGDDHCWVVHGDFGNVCCESKTNHEYSFHPLPGGGFIRGCCNVGSIIDQFGNCNVI